MDIAENVEIINLKKDQVFSLEGDMELDLYLITSGRVMICMRKGTTITPIAYINQGEFIGELSFFDHRPRSADVIATEETSLIKIPQKAKANLPDWVDRLLKYMSIQIRNLDEATRKHGIRKTRVDTIKPLTIDEQRHYLGLINNFIENR